MRNLKPIVDALVPKETRRCILRDIQLEESGEVVAKWTMLGKVSLPWSPRINVGGKTRYTPGEDGRIESYFEKWDIPAGEALGQLLKPTSSEEVEHWPDQLLGASPPEPKHVAKTSVSAVLFPGFGNDAIDYSEPLTARSSQAGMMSCFPNALIILLVTYVSCCWGSLVDTRSHWARMRLLACRPRLVSLQPFLCCLICYCMCTPAAQNFAEHCQPVSRRASAGVESRLQSYRSRGRTG